MNAREWSDRASYLEVQGDNDANTATGRAVADLNATLCFMMADLIRLLDQPFRRVPGPR